MQNAFIILHFHAQIFNDNSASKLTIDYVEFDQYMQKTIIIY